MNNIQAHLHIIPEEVCDQIEDFLKSQLETLGRSGILIGISGGLDSALALYLSVRGVGKERVRAYYLPEHDSKPLHRKHAQWIAHELGIRMDIIDLTPILKTIGVYRLLPIRFLPTRRLKSTLVRFGRRLTESGEPEDLLQERFRGKPNSLISKGNAYASIKHRMRMVLLYYHAEIHNLMVVGAANKTEWLTGTFSKWGVDQCADVMPILHLYRSQLMSIAEYLDIPEEIRSKAADPDVLPGLDDKERLLGSFQVTDQILWGLEHGLSQEDLATQFGEKIFDRILGLWESSRHMRQSPYRME
jgi:NAD+ synthase